MKRKITLEEAYRLIESADAVIIDDNGLCYHSLWGLTGESDNEWLYCSWEDTDKYNEFSVKFIEEKQDIFFDGTTIFMQDEDGEDTEVTLLVKMKPDVFAMLLDE